ncbi:hypothetical protein Aduo_019402 [Ancylostoma duodenale]
MWHRGVLTDRRRRFLTASGDSWIGSPQPADGLDSLRTRASTVVRSPVAVRSLVEGDLASTRAKCLTKRCTTILLVYL